MMPLRAGLVMMAAILTLSACADTDGVPDEPDGALEVAVATDAQLVAGRQVYDDVCSECHSLQPPPNLAPPITHIARRLRSQLDGRAAFIDHVVAHIPDPSEERSLLPAHAIERFGLMPAQALSDDQLDGVAAWLWVMADSAQGGREMMAEEGGMGGGMQGQGGMGGGMGRGMQGEGGMGGMQGGGAMHRGGGMGMGGASNAGDTLTATDTLDAGN